MSTKPRVKKAKAAGAKRRPTVAATGAKKKTKKKASPRRRTPSVESATEQPTKPQRAAAPPRTRAARTRVRAPAHTPVRREPPAPSLTDEDDDDRLDAELGIGSRVVPPLVTFDDAAPDSSPPASGFDAERDVDAQIRALEARLDGLLGASTALPVSSPVATRVEPSAEHDGAATSPKADAVAELITSEFFASKWSRRGLQGRSHEVDDFGLDPAFERRIEPLIDFLFQRYFRTEVRGIDAVPAEGRCMVVANHSGTVPFDGLMLRAALRLTHPTRRELRWLAEDFVYYLPFIGSFVSRVGAVRACQENAERLLQKDALVGVFPEGVKGIGKRFSERYRLQRFGRGGFIRLALRTQCPIVPCAIIGAEETNPLLYRFETFTKALGVPYVPVTPTFPWLGLAGLVPAPTKWTIVFGAPLHLDAYGPEAASDHMLVGRLAERVRHGIQELLDGGVARRKSVWFG
ncbi:MAG: acyltransferase family protein [Polyangiaceae bacterium]|nr:acyltransferase family protein [Polyangiaceae bacterium]